MADGHWVEYGNVMLQRYLHIADPGKLSDDEWAIKLKLLEKLMKAEAKSS